MADHRLESTPSYKPHSSAKAFLYDCVPVTRLADEQDQIPRYAPLELALFCVPPVQWRHTQRSSWERIMNAFAAFLHHFQAPVAVEVFLCDNENSEFLRRPWIGFVHSTPKKSGQTWVPDLQRLCTGKEYLPALQHCVGLFALTSINAEYLREHLRCTCAYSRDVPSLSSCSSSG